MLLASGTPPLSNVIVLLNPLHITLNVAVAASTQEGVALGGSDGRNVRLARGKVVDYLSVEAVPLSQVNLKVFKILAPRSCIRLHPLNSHRRWQPWRLRKSVA